MNPTASRTFLGHHDERRIARATEAEERFGAEPTTPLVNLRQLGNVNLRLVVRDLTARLHLAREG